MSVFGSYSRYYDLLYRDKDYPSEARYVDGLIRRRVPAACSMLEFGCGTGRYTREFARLGYAVHGVDLSADMIDEARKTPCDGVSFSCGDMRSLRLGKKFDAVVALFHVLSYQTSDEDVVNALKTVREHLASDGTAILDFWYGPAVLTQRPEVRFKEVSDEAIEVSRIAIPELHDDLNVVDVNYRAFIRDKASGRIEELRECHRMRYFFMKDFSWMLPSSDLSLSDVAEWMTGQSLGAHSWSAVASFLVQKPQGA